MAMWDDIECMVEACTLPVLHSWLCKKHGSMLNRYGRTWRVRAATPEISLRENSEAQESGFGF